MRTCAYAHAFVFVDRSWFVTAANPLKKNVVVIIDQSASMSEPVRVNGKWFSKMEVAKDAAKTVMESFSARDYVSNIQ